MSMIGQELSHYRIEARVGGGGMGVIYRARDLALDRTVALKFLPPQLSDDAEAKERFLREAKAASALDHPNICTIHEIGETDDGQLFIVMAHYEGETLEQTIRNGPLPVAKALGLVWQICDGLARSHRRDIVHRDIKPANLFLTDDGQIKILDFGLAKTQGQGQSFDGLTQGTPAYMAPEQIRGSAPDPRNDLWSVGVVLYEMLARARPFDGDSIPEIVAAIFADDPQPLAEHRPGLPPALTDLVDRLLQHDPGDRPQDCAAVHAELEPLLEARPPTATASGRWRVAAPPEAPQNRSLAPALGALVLVATALVLVPTPWWPWTTSTTEAPVETAEPPEVAESEAEPPRTTLAVLFFDNLSGQPELDWLRTGLADMLVTDLSQSNDLDVVSTAQWVEALAAEDDPLTGQTSAADIARRLVERLPVDRVVVGSVVESGGTLRIQTQIQEAASGRILDTHKVEGDGEAALFSMVDTLSHGIRQQLTMSHGEDRPTDLDIATLTTKSVEALRFYVEGMRLHLQFKEAEAAELFHRAVELDPGFGMAWAKLAVTHRNLGRPEAYDYAAKALAAGPLDQREKHYIEGFYYGFDLATWGRAIEALERAVELDPRFHAARQNLMVYTGNLEMSDAAIAHGEALLAGGSQSRGGYAMLAEVLTATGQDERAEQLLLDLARLRPGDFAAHSALGWLYRRSGRFDEALERFATADSLRPGTTYNLEGLCATHILRHDWSAVDRVVDRASTLDEPGQRTTAQECRLTSLMLRGHSAEALALAREMVGRTVNPIDRAEFQLWEARLHLARGETHLALRQGLAARETGRGELVESRALAWTGTAALAMGDRVTLEKVLDDLAKLARPIPGPVLARRHQTLAGQVALDRGELERARQLLEAAAATLPARGVVSELHVPDHVVVRSTLAKLYRRTGEPERELAQLAALGTATDALLVNPIDWVRARFRFATLVEELGQTQRATELRRQLDTLWASSDLSIAP